MTTTNARVCVCICGHSLRRGRFKSREPRINRVHVATIKAESSQPICSPFPLCSSGSSSGSTRSRASLFLLCVVLCSPLPLSNWSVRYVFCLMTTTTTMWEEGRRETAKVVYSAPSVYLLVDSFMIWPPTHVHYTYTKGTVVVVVLVYVLLFAMRLEEEEEKEEVSVCLES